MLALPMTATAPAFAEPSYSSSDIQPVDWWWNQTGTTATSTPIMVGTRGGTNTAASGIPAIVHVVSRHRCGKIGTQDIQQRLTTSRRKPRRRELVAIADSFSSRLS